MGKYIFEIDYSGTKKLYEYYQDFGKLYDDFLEDFLKAAGIRMLDYTVKNTPTGIHAPIYGTTGGTLRRAWKLTPILRRGNDIKITLYADSRMAPYAIYVEEGHRTLAYSPKTGKRIYFQLPDGTWRASKDGWVEGQHMARNAFDKVKRGLDSAYVVAFNKFIRRLEGSHH